ncbi:response regulator transcription factor [Vreelandella aquamarina]|jgi:DNA-binding NarL/FixJ family response regulator|uniref:response regulator n=1 Tax=Vreelandella aquamarina TaxID=77097 RepID=UPI001196A28C|nr:response regulator transcription factor [Halomonas sp.]TVM04830.1 MAG: response regulator transcription factor [Halomonas sp.]
MRILIADDHDLLRDTLELWFTREGMDMTSTRDLEHALRVIAEDDTFDFIMLDYTMRGMNGLEGLKRVIDAAKGARVAIMSGTAPRDVAFEALEIGAAGFVPKTLPARSLVNAVRFMAMGEQYVPHDFMTAEEEAPPEHPLVQQLTRRELQVLEKLCDGLSNKEIARALSIEEPTVKLHMKTLYRKIGVQNRTQAALLAKEAGLF